MPQAQSMDAKYVFSRLDEATIIQFLTSHATALANQDWLSPTEADDLRLLLTSQFGTDSAENSQNALLWLHSQKSSFLEKTTARLGIAVFYKNLWRLSMREYVSELQGLLSEIGSDLTSKTELYLNRTFTVYYSGLPEYRCFLSEVLVNTAELLSEQVEELESVQRNLSTWSSSPTWLDCEKHDILENELMSTLGFKSKKEDWLPWQTENKILLKLTSVTQVVVSVLDSFLDQLQQNNNHWDIAGARFALNSLESSIHNIGPQMSVRDPLQLVQLEQRRQSHLSAIKLIYQYLQSFNSELAEKTLRVSQVSQLTSDLNLGTKELQRVVENQLNNDGQDPHDSKSASNKLFEYCRQKETLPSDLIVAELHTIDKHLNQNALEAFVHATDKLDNPKSTLRKEQSHVRSRKLASQFHDRLKALGVLGLIFLLPLSSMFLNSCGRKKDPSSKDKDIERGLFLEQEKEAFKKTPTEEETKTP